MINIFHTLLSILCLYFFDINQDNEHNNKNDEMNIIINKQVFKAVLYDNPTAEKFKALLPITIEMKELNNNEKYTDIPGKLSTNPTNPGNIEAGDIMIYETNTLVLFYKSFRTNYSYTKVGRIEDPRGLESSLGKKEIIISFELN